MAWLSKLLAPSSFATHKAVTIVRCSTTYQDFGKVDMMVRAPYIFLVSFFLFFPFIFLSADDGIDTSAVGLVHDGPAICTGTLIAPGWVLTAAHCAENKTDAKLVFSLKRTPGGVEIKRSVHRSFTHPGYHNIVRDDTPETDISLLQLDRDDYNQAPTHYPDLYHGDMLQKNTSSILVGYGFDNAGNKGILKIKRVLANGIFLNPDKFAGTAMIQILPGPMGENACEGDSGSPILKYIGGKLSIIAVMSTVIANKAILARAEKADSAAGARFLCNHVNASYATTINYVSHWVSQIISSGGKTTTISPVSPTLRQLRGDSLR